MLSPQFVMLSIWSDPLPRLGALLSATVVLGMTVALLRQGAFTPRTIVELRFSQQPNEPAVFTITSAGKPLPAEVALTYPDGEHQLSVASGMVPNDHTLREMTVQLPACGAKELKVWAHQLTPDGVSELLPVSLVIHQGQNQQEITCTTASAPLLVPTHGHACRVTIQLGEVLHPAR